MTTKKEIIDYCANKKALLITENQTDRVTWKKLFSDFGIKPGNILGANNLAEGLKELQTKLPELIISSSEIESIEAVNLYNEHLKLLQDRSKALFFMVSDKNSLMLTSSVLENEMDGFLIKPYNNYMLNSTVESAILRKLNMGTERTKYFAIKSLINQNELDNAENNAHNFLQEAVKKELPHFLLALINYKKQNFTMAIEHAEAALKLNPTHLQTLGLAFDLYVKQKDYVNAYAHAQTLIKNYPLNPSRIPDIIKVSVATENFQNIIDFCELVLEISSASSQYQLPIAAGLVISAKALYKSNNNLTLIKNITYKAIELARNHLNITTSALEVLMLIQDYKKVRQILDDIPTDHFTLPMFEFDIQLKSQELSPDKTYIEAQNLIKKNIRSTKVYTVLLDSCIKTGKDKKMIEDIINSAVNYFPEDTAIFKHYL